MPPSAPLLVFVSMFAPMPAGGVRAFHLDRATGQLEPAAAASFPNSFFLTTTSDGRTLYALTAEKFGDAATEEVTSWRIKRDPISLESLGRQPAGGAATCYLAADAADRSLFLAFYNGSAVARLPLTSDGRLAMPPVSTPHDCGGSGVVAGRQDGPHPHAIIPAPTAGDGPRIAFAADLGCDAIIRFRMDEPSGRLEPLDPLMVKTPAGSGPRHLTFDPAGRRLYAINELSNTIGAYDFDATTGGVTERQIISTLPGNFAGTSSTADLRFTPDGRFLYGTNRGHDSLAAYAVGDDGWLTLVEIVPSGGRGPQNIAITPCGRLLLCANMPGDSLSVFRIDGKTGRLTLVGEPVAVSKPSSIAIVP